MIDYQSAKDWRWVIDAEEVQFTAVYGGLEILCRVTRDCIEDHCGNPATSDACFTAAKEHFGIITDQIGIRIAAGQFQPDGSVLLRSQDWLISRR